jgi:sugar phosphate isomerase/epimerase
MSKVDRKVLVSCVQFEDGLKKGLMSVLEVAPIAKWLGVDGVEYREVYWRNKQEELPAVRCQIEKLGLLATYATFSPLQNREEKERERLLTDIEDAAALGSPLLRIFRGPDPEPGKEDEVYGAAEAAIRRAADLGVVLALENHIGELGNKLSQVQEAVARFSVLGLHVNIDVSNYILNDQDLMRAIRLFAPLIVYSHLKDVKEAPNGRASTYLGAGSLVYADILAEFDRTGRNFPLCLEFCGEGDPEGEITKSLEYLRSIGWK